MRRLGAVRVGGALLIAAGALAFSAVPAAADPGTTPDSGDSRAVAHTGNVTTCAGAGLTGTTVDGDDLVGDGHATLTDDRTMVTIRSLPADTELTAIVVKGGDAYNVYQPGARGLPDSPPYTDLHSPLVGQDRNVPTISHWFACATTAGPSGGQNGTGSAGPSPTPTTGTVEAASSPAPGAGSGTLANTGFDAAVPAVLGLVLLAGGVVTLLAGRRLATASGRIRRH